MLLSYTRRNDESNSTSDLSEAQLKFLTAVKTAGKYVTLIEPMRIVSHILTA